jgi:hypothetical protein
VRTAWLPPRYIYPMVYSRGMTEQAREARRRASVLTERVPGEASVAPSASCSSIMPISSHITGESWSSMPAPRMLVRVEPTCGPRLATWPKAITHFAFARLLSRE